MSKENKMKGKTLGVLLLALGFGAGLMGCEVRNLDYEESRVEKQEVVQERELTRKVTGLIESIDEDPLPIRGYNKAVTLQIEHIRVIANEGGVWNRYRLIFPGPSGYLKGDRVEFEYKPMSSVTYDDLLNVIVSDWMDNPAMIQKGSFDNIHGIIVKGKFLDK